MQTLRKTKILCTLGPASSSPQIIEALMLAGADGFRLNFSHGNYETFRNFISQIREIAKRLDRSAAILQDLQGPKIRVSTLKDGKAVELKAGEKFVITTRPVEGTAEIISTTYANLPKDVKTGDRILINDGAIELSVSKKTDADVETKIIVGGPLEEKKGINLPGVKVSAVSLTEKDIADARFGIEQNVDYIALSFVRTASDIRRLRSILQEANRTDIRIVAKIEKPEAVQNLREILEASDGVMVARGDLGVEMPAEKIPLIQKFIIESANKAEKLVITATQMLESMVNHSRPTRAEASDVANAILDGTDVVMLSQETAVGLYPAKAVRTMATIAQYTESDDDIYKYTDRLRPQTITNFTHAIVHSARAAAAELKAKAIIVFTQSGVTAELASCQRPESPIFAFTQTEKTFHQLALVWGVYPVFLPFITLESGFQMAEEYLLKRSFLKKGDAVVIVSGTQPVRGATNMMKVERVGSVVD
jgi:pyruvate kinase